MPHISIFLLDDTELMWNSNFHMHVVTLCQEMRTFKSSCGEVLGSKNIEFIESKEQVKEKIPAMTFDICIEHNIVLAIKISERHSLQTYLENVYVTNRSSFFVSIENIFVNLDGAHLMEIKDFDIKSLAELNVLSAERKNYDHFRLATNKIWATSIGVFR